jgi:hypothetical protein
MLNTTSIKTSLSVLMPCTVETDQSSKREKSDSVFFPVLRDVNRQVPAEFNRE